MAKFFTSGQKAGLKYLLTICLVWMSTYTFGQGVITGSVSDNQEGTPLVGARVIIEGARAGGLTDANGNFNINAPSNPPFTLLVTYFGYDTLRQEVTTFDKKLKLKLSADSYSVEEVVITSTLDEKKKQAALTMESMSINAIKETPSLNFYDGLGALREVDLTAASIGFKVINTRGFNSAAPVRSLQIIDGVDNQSPGLNFSLGNFLGASDLDVEQVDLIVGASSAYYGPNAFNGVISMKTKNPFVHRGLSVSAKVGERNLGEIALRYAKVFNNKAGKDKFAFKINAFYLTVDDWEADNLDPVDGVGFGLDNPGGYDAVNRYGDENTTDGRNNALSRQDQIDVPGLRRWFRTGYEERDLVDYDTRNLKLAAALHYKIKDDVELIMSGSYANGTTVLQGDNRFSLKNIDFYQGRVEVKKEGKFFLRAYATGEDAGDSYDAVFTALRLQERSLDDNEWSEEYRNYWRSNIVPRVKELTDPDGGPFPEIILFPTISYDFETADRILDANQPLLTQWHDEARRFADSQIGFGAVPRLEPGTAEFNQALNEITSTPLTAGGTRLVDRSKLYHVHGEYMFNPTFADIRVGANARLYAPESDGTIFSDTDSTSITNFEFGVYGGVQKKVLAENLTLSATLRMDKNENFDFVFSPAVSAVYQISENDVLRVSFSSAIRNPTLADQYLDYDVGTATLLGNLEGFQQIIDTASLSRYFDSNLDVGLIERFDIDPIQPEKVQTVELGYRTTLFERLFLDATYYYSRYQDFIGFNLGVDAAFDANRIILNSIEVFRVAANATDIVTTQGFSVSGSYFLNGGYAFTGNYSWNRLNSESADPIIPAYNTPEHKYNIGFSGRDVTLLGISNLGFNINYKWIEGFFFEGSPQFTGNIPTYDMLDVQVNKRVPSINTTFKLGASNVLNNSTFQLYGGPRVGRLVYFSVATDLTNL